MRDSMSLALWALGVIWNLKSISMLNRLRLWKKTCALYVAFLPFADLHRPKDQLDRTMKSALLSALYDYETDWVRVVDPFLSISFRLLEQYVHGEALIALAKNLFILDWGRQLSSDGLERGGLAMQFYADYIGSLWLAPLSTDEVHLLGRKLQLVDDLMDVERDLAAEHQNCFLTGDWPLFMDELKRFLESDFFEKLRRRSWVYAYLHSKCKWKLKQMEVPWPPSLPL